MEYEPVESFENQPLPYVPRHSAEVLSALAKMALRPPDEGTDWRTWALCSVVSPDIFDQRYGEVERAKELCAACSVRAACLAYALETDQDFQVWGGLTALERRRLKQKRNVLGAD